MSGGAATTRRSRSTHSVMADNVYLLETRLSKPQQAALSYVRDVARQHALTVFLVGGAVRDLISGSPVRDLDVAVQGNALDLRADLEGVGGSFSGQDDELQALYLRFPGSVRIEVGSTLSVTYPKPGQPVYQPTSMLEDLRRRDFTANAMALSLNDGSYGLLMDPLNGVADIENRELRLVSNYGFIEDPIRMIRAARLMARLGWQMDERTRARYETGKEENYISAMRPVGRAYELEELFHEEDPLRVMRRLEEEGWLGQLSPTLGIAKANTAELGRLREVQMQFQTRGVVADASSANFALLTSKLSSGEVAEIRKSFPRVGFVEEISTLEGAAKELTSKLLSKELAAPSAAFQYLMKAPASTVVYAAFSSRSTALQNRLKSFLTEWPSAQGKVPYVLMQEMRITPDLPQYGEVVEKVTFAMMDGELETAEEMRAFLEPFSPPAPPPPVSLRRPRAPRKEAKPKGKKKVAVAAAAEVEAEPAAEMQASAPGEKTPGEKPAAVAPAKSPVVPVPAAAPAAKAAAPSKAAVAVVEPAKPALKAAPPAKAAATAKVAAPVVEKKKAAPADAAKKVAKSVTKAAAPAQVAKAPAKGTVQPAKVAKQSSPAAKPAPTKALVKAKVATVKPVAKPIAKGPAAKAGVKAAAGKPAKTLANKNVAAKRPAVPVKSAKKAAAKGKR